MSTTPPITAWVPSMSADMPAEHRRLFTLAFQKLGNHATAFGLQQAKINSITSGTTTTIEESSSSGGGSVTSSTSGIPVNNQSGATSYTTASTDDGALILLSNSSPISVTLTSQSPPWSCFIANQSALGGGSATLTPASGTINGAATLALLPSYFALVAFDGTNWFAATLPIVPVSFGPISHEFLTEYNAATGSFSAAQPAFTDISGIAQVAQGGTGTSSPSLVAGTNVSISGSWPNQTINASGGSGSSYLKGTISINAGGASSGTFNGTTTVTGAAVGMCAVASILGGPVSGTPAASIQNILCGVSSTNTVMGQVTLPNIGLSWGTITLEVVVFP